MRSLLIAVAAASLLAVHVSADSGCPTNETISNCYYECPPNTCAARGEKYTCAMRSEHNCLKGCVCEPGYRRDGDEGNCVLDADCRGGGDPNAAPGPSNNNDNTGHVTKPTPLSTVLPLVKVLVPTGINL